MDGAGVFWALRCGSSRHGFSHLQRNPQSMEHVGYMMQTAGWGWLGVGHTCNHESLMVKDKRVMTEQVLQTCGLEEFLSQPMSFSSTCHSVSQSITTRH